MVYSLLLKYVICNMFVYLLSIHEAYLSVVVLLVPWQKRMFHMQTCHQELDAVYSMLRKQIRKSCYKERLIDSLHSSECVNCSGIANHDNVKKCIAYSWLALTFLPQHISWLLCIILYKVSYHFVTKNLPTICRRKRALIVDSIIQLQVSNVFLFSQPYD